LGKGLRSFKAGLHDEDEKEKDEENKKLPKE